MTPYQQGCSRAHSLLYRATGLQEVTSTMACFYVLRNENALYESHPAANLVLASALSAEHDEEPVVGISPFPSEDVVVHLSDHNSVMVAQVDYYTTLSFLIC